MSDFLIIEKSLVPVITKSEFAGMALVRSNALPRTSFIVLLTSNMSSIEWVVNRNANAVPTRPLPMIEIN